MIHKADRNETPSEIPTAVHICGFLNAAKIIRIEINSQGPVNTA
jgi:hypothetical protein